MPGRVNAPGKETSIVEPHQQADYAEEVRLSLAFPLPPTFETECSQ
jgi:hypothetical protein